MNQELEDLMLEYLLRKKLNMTIKTNTLKSAPIKLGRPPKSKNRRALGRHIWTEQDAQKIAFLHKQGLSHRNIAREMAMRVSQVSGAIRAMQDPAKSSRLPRLLADQS